jgi:hypothetical protein
LRLDKMHQNPWCTRIHDARDCIWGKCLTCLTCLTYPNLLSQWSETLFPFSFQWVTRFCLTCLKCLIENTTLLFWGYNKAQPYTLVEIHTFISRGFPYWNPYETMRHLRQRLVSHWKL